MHRHAHGTVAAKANQQHSATQVHSSAHSPLDFKCQAGILNQLLREQLQPLQSQVTEAEPVCTDEDVSSAAVAVVHEMLSGGDRALLRLGLNRLYQGLREIYLDADIAPALRKRQFIARSGLILSPDNCLGTVLDTLRMRAFVCGIDKAIAARMQTKPEGALRLAYPACGPFAPLLLPLIAFYRASGRYSAAQLQLHLIDMQPGAIASLQVVIARLGIGEYVAELVCADALDYRAKCPLDLVVLEAMQHGCSREGQLALARHFVAQLAPDGHMLPQEIHIDAVFTSCQREFVDQWQGASQVSLADADQRILSERTWVGEVLFLNAERLRQLPVRRLDEHTELLECNRLTIPELDRAREQTLLLCTRLRVWGDEVLDEYDSGITHPLPDQQVCANFIPKEFLPGDLLVRSGDLVQFFYRLNGLPGFLTTLVPREESHD